MTSKDTKENEKEQMNNMFKKLNSDFFLQKLFEFLPKNISLKTIKYNKYVQKRMKINVYAYKEYSETYTPIEIEIIPKKNKYDTFINIKKEDKKYYQIFFNDNKEKEIKKTHIKSKDNVSIIIDHQDKSFAELFNRCYCIESIKFKKFYRNNIIDMNQMFRQCEALKELDLTNFKTDNVTDLSAMFMFADRTLLKGINLANFNTSKVTNMGYMFYNCSLIEELNLTNLILMK